MAIITLTTDLGNKDFYVAIVKAKLFEAIDQPIIIDISHEIEPFNIVQGAFVLSCAYEDFPEGTIHLVGIDTSSKSKKHNGCGLWIRNN